MKTVCNLGDWLLSPRSQGQIQKKLENKFMDMLIFIRLGYKDKLTNNLRQVGQQGQM